MPAIIKPSRLAVAVRCEPVPQGGLLTVSAFLLSDFASPRDFLTEQALWPMVVEQMGGAIFDKGNLKPCGEWIVAGTAMAPGDEPVAGVNVVARLAEVEKRLTVFGDRFWRQTDRGIVLLPAVPFDRMPIDEAHAFGGSRFAANPRGKGHGARALLDAGLDAPLPNVENAGRPVRSPDDAPNPVHFGPLAPDAASRLRYVGTYDQTWLKTLAPLRPADFNPLFHCDAPEDQRLPGYFAGQEAFSVSGMTRGGMVGGRLPNAVIRGFAHRPADDSLTEIRMVCDTVTLFPNITKMALAFRGIVKCADAFAEDIGTVMLAVEHAEDEARPPAYFGEIFRLRTHPEEAHRHALSDFQLMPKRDEAVVSARRAARLEKAKADRERFMDNQDWMARKMVADQGMSPDLLPPMEREGLDDLPLVALPSGADIEKGDFDLAEILDDVTALTSELKLRGRRAMAGVELNRKQLVDSLPDSMTPDVLRQSLVDDEALLEFPDLTSDLPEFGEQVDFRQPEPPLGEFQAEALEDIKTKVDALFASLDGAGFDTAENADRQYDKACARALGLPEGAEFHDVRRMLQEAAQPIARSTNLADDASDIERRIADRIASLADMPLSGGSTRSDVDNHLGAVDLPPGMKDLASLDGGMAEKLKSVLPTSRSVAEGGSIGDIIDEMVASFPKTDTPPAGSGVQEVMEHAVAEALVNLDHTEVRLDTATRQARSRSPVALFPAEPFLPGVANRFGDFVRERIGAGHDFRGADLAGADLHGIDLHGRDLCGTFFENCDLREANLSGANLDGAVFAGCNLTGADLSGASLVSTNFGGATLAAARFDGCRYEKMNFIQADMTGVSWRSGTLDEVTLIECRMDAADFSGSVFSQVQILKGQAPRAKFDGLLLDRVTFIQVPLVSASFVDARFDRVTLAEIDASQASFKGAHFNISGFLGNTGLRDADFERVFARSTSWNTADMTRTCLLRVDMDSCLFNACDLSNADMRLATLKNCRLDKSVLVGADLFAANLLSASLTSCDMTRASLRGANLYYAALDRAELASCDLTGANLGGTRMERATHA